MSTAVMRAPTWPTTTILMSFLSRTFWGMMPNLAPRRATAFHGANRAFQTFRGDGLSTGKDPLRQHFYSRLANRKSTRSKVAVPRMTSTPTVGPDGTPSFKIGDKIQVEVMSFGPLGASVAVVGLGHGGDVSLLPVDAEPYGEGLILQQEIVYFRQSRDNVDVVRGEVLPAFVHKIREEDGKLGIGLRPYGGKAKSNELGSQILDKLKLAPDGTLRIGDKSTPAEINAEFPGVSKSVFKKTIGALYKKGLVSPAPNSITLAKKQGGKK